MSFSAGIKPAEVYSSDDVLSGKAGWRVGQRVQSDDGKEYVFCLVAAGQNLVSGNIVSLINNASFGTVAILATGAPAPGTAMPLGRAVCSVTASASNYIWVQVFGSAAVSITDATASNLPGHIVIPGSVAGAVRGGLATASSYIEGLTFTATASTGATGAMFLSYPRLAPA
ncbi:MAG TPA: hypothetical protein VNK48_14635 [Xanthobacteraceae bacterium]|nr:hypothetical protein [Xanthobacteraceae bacterium]